MSFPATSTSCQARDACLTGGAARGYPVAAAARRRQRADGGDDPARGRARRAAAADRREPEVLRPVRFHPRGRASGSSRRRRRCGPQYFMLRALAAYDPGAPRPRRSIRPRRSGSCTSGRRRPRRALRGAAAGAATGEGLSATRSRAARAAARRSCRRLYQAMGELPFIIGTPLSCPLGTAPERGREPKTPGVH